MKETALDLVADIGGTNARFAVARDGVLENVTSVACADYDAPLDAIAQYLAEKAGARPRRAAIAIATPITGDRVTLTNFDWTFDAEEIRDTFDLERVRLLNDFTAQALAVPIFQPEDLEEIRGGTIEIGAPRAIVGPGTGLGVAGLVEVYGCGLAPMPAEGGHRDLAATTDREWEVRKRLAAVHGHVSCEHVVSGPGLVNLYRALCDIDGETPRFDDPGAIVAASVNTGNGDRLAAETVETWSALLGALAGDLALIMGALGGVYLAGGVLAKMGDAFRRDAFLKRFESKGPMSYFVRKMPVFHVIHPHPGLLGASRAFDGLPPCD